MLEKSGQIYCQRCLTANALGQELCTRCGTRLMLVVEPTALRFEEVGGTNVAPVEHLLERISTLENRLAHLTDKLEHGFRLLLRHARSSYLDHSLLETLVEVLGDAGSVDRTRLDRQWRMRCERETMQLALAEQRELLVSRILFRSENEDRQDGFETAVREAFVNLDQGRLAIASRMLVRAASLAPKNTTLNAFLGDYFFNQEKPRLARRYLERAVAHDDAELRAALLLGLLCGEDGEIKRARMLLRRVISQGHACFAAHYALGRLLASENNWKGALGEFKHAHAARPCAESHYVLGAVFYQLEKLQSAKRHLRKATEMDPAFGEAHFALGIVNWRLEDRVRAARDLSAAESADPGNRRYRQARQQLRKHGSMPPILTLFGPSRNPAKGLMFSGDKRLAAVLKEDTRESALAR